MLFTSHGISAGVVENLWLRYVGVFHSIKGHKPLIDLILIFLHQSVLSKSCFQSAFPL